MSTPFDLPVSERPDAAAPRQQERQQILNRLRRAEGQLRGLQRMIEEGADCMAVVTQLAAVRRALESTQLRMTRCHLLERMRQDAGVANPEAVDQILDEMETLIGRVR
jgi:DNA-binding FrmR family transcriptional regulator